tara:strand:+ start:17556 stop:19280 length:1725 start_codon:yes stop_codon:yes gene_type:complete
MIRQPIVILVGHVDHGKSSILEHIKGISITKGEAGGITQTLKSYNVPLLAIQQVCGNLLQTLNQTFTIPGLLFLDSPGHAAFNNMRKRGGNLADIAILVIDAKEGVKEQTLESIAILKQYKTPFIIALNKIDQISGWRSAKTGLLENIQNQTDALQQDLDTKLYTLVGKLSEAGINAERFDRVKDYTQQVAIVPLSAKTGEGLPELFMVLTGLAQKYLEESLETEVKGPGKGTILEVTEEEGLGVCLDVVIYDGTLQVGDTIAIGGVEKPIITKVRSLFTPEKNQQGKVQSVKEVHAAQGVRICAPDLKQAVGGMPLRVANKNTEEIAKAIQEEIQEVFIDTDDEGIVIKADTIGSLEALLGLLKKENIPIKRASIGEITKKDITEATAEENPLYRVLLGFNVKPVQQQNLKIITHRVIYKLIEDLQEWTKEQIKNKEQQELAELTKPCKIKLLRGCVFRQSNPAVVGVQVQVGTLKTDTVLIKEDGSGVGIVKALQLEGKTVTEAKTGEEVAISIPGVVVGRQIKEEDILLSDLTGDTFKKLKTGKNYLNEDEIDILKTIAQLKRKTNPTWGM